MAVGDFLPVDDGVTYPASSIAPSEAVANITAEGLDPDYKGEPFTKIPPTWIVYALIAVAIYLLMEEE
jgi:preprotein translocase subunit Sec61beta